MAFIDVIQHQEAEGELLKIYDDLVQSRGKLAEVHKILSLNPKTIVTHMDLYISIMFGKSPLKRYQREMIGVIVSVFNKCPYCIRHHEEALLFFWKDQTRTANLIHDYHSANLSPADRLLCDLGRSISLDPNFEGKVKLYNQMRENGLDDRCILDANLVAAYFNFVNRLVLGLGVELEDDGGTGYNYE